MNDSGRTEQGMTFVEVLIAGTFGALLLLSLAAATGNVFDTYSAGFAEIELSRDLAQCMDTVTKAVRNASKATSPDTHRLVLIDAEGNELAFGWSATTGDPLIMRVAGTDNYTLLPSIEDFTVQINEVNVEAEQNVEATETFISFDHYPSSENWHCMEIGPDDWRGAEFVIPMDEEVEKIKLTQVGFRVGKTGLYRGNMQVVLCESRACTHPIPIKPVIAKLDVANADIINAEWGGTEWWLYWMTIDLTDDFLVYPNRRYCMFLRGTSSYQKACMIRVRESMDDHEPDNGIRMHRTTDGGTTWWPSNKESDMDIYDIPFELTGVKVTKSPQTFTRQHSVDITLTVKKNGHSQTMKRREHLRGGSYKP